MEKYITSYFQNDIEKTLQRMEKASVVIMENKEKPLSEITLFDAITMSGSGLFSPQKRTGFLEDKMRSIFSWRKVKATENKGDYIDCDGKYFELKCSSTNDSNTINILQIRPWQDVDYYRIVYFDLDDSSKSKSYILTKSDMLSEIEKNGNAIHGTKDANKSNNKIEYAIHLPIENEWDNLYLDEIFFK